MLEIILRRQLHSFYSLNINRFFTNFLALREYLSNEHKKLLILSF